MQAQKHFIAVCPMVLPPVPEYFASGQQLCRMLVFGQVCFQVLQTALILELVILTRAAIQDFDYSGLKALRARWLRFFTDGDGVFHIERF
jgi:hypothetical protein